MEGCVVRSTGKWCKVVLENGQRVDARLKGKLRLKGLTTTNPVAVGDWVHLEKQQDDTYQIFDIDERENVIIRQSPRHRNRAHIIAANIDQALLMVTLSKPRTSTGFIDRFLVTAEAYHIPVLVVFNKDDVATEKDKAQRETLRAVYEGLGYQTLVTSAVSGKGINQLKTLLKDKTTLLCGHSGVGKSTLINAMDSKLNLKTSDISRKYEKGKHTTTYAERFPLSFGGYVIDVPGVKEFGVVDFKAEDIGHYFPEIREQMTACRFSNCIHENEPGCAVKEEGKMAPSRYKNYLEILDDIREAKEW